MVSSMSVHSFRETSFKNSLGRRGHAAGRLDWCVAASLGLADTDAISAPIHMPAWRAIADLYGLTFQKACDNTSIRILYSPSEGELAALVGRLAGNQRIVAYNDERRLSEIPLRSFDMATACLFDSDSETVVRIFDRQPRSNDDYIHVEVADLTEAALSFQAQRIASLRTGAC